MIYFRNQSYSDRQPSSLIIESLRRRHPDYFRICLFILWCESLGTNFTLRIHRPFIIRVMLLFDRHALEASFKSASCHVESTDDDGGRLSR